MFMACCNKEARRAYCSDKCRNKAGVDRRRKKLKQLAIAYKGGKCQFCGYNSCCWALEFHHMNPNEKDFSLASSGVTRS